MPRQACAAFLSDRGWLPGVAQSCSGGSRWRSRHEVGRHGRLPARCRHRCQGSTGPLEPDKGTASIQRLPSGEDCEDRVTRCGDRAQEIALRQWLSDSGLRACPAAKAEARRFGLAAPRLGCPRPRSLAARCARPGPQSSRGVLVGARPGRAALPQRSCRACPVRATRPLPQDLSTRRAQWGDRGSWEAREVGADSRGSGASRASRRCQTKQR